MLQSPPIENWCNKEHCQVHKDIGRRQRPEDGVGVAHHKHRQTVGLFVHNAKSHNRQLQDVIDARHHRIDERECNPQVTPDFLIWRGVVMETDHQYDKRWGEQQGWNQRQHLDGLE